MKKLIQAIIAFFRRLFGGGASNPTKPPKVSNLKIKRAVDPDSGAFSYHLGFDLNNENTISLEESFVVFYRYLPQSDNGAPIHLPTNISQGHSIGRSETEFFCFPVYFDGEPEIGDTYDFYVLTGGNGDGFNIAFEEVVAVSVEEGSCTGAPPKANFKSNNLTQLMSDPPRVSNLKVKRQVDPMTANPLGDNNSSADFIVHNHHSFEMQNVVLSFDWSRFDAPIPDALDFTVSVGTIAKHSNPQISELPINLVAQGNVDDSDSLHGTYTLTFDYQSGDRTITHVHPGNITLNWED